MIDQLSQIFADHGDEEDARYMESYLKGQFPFFGIKSKKRNDLTKKFFSENGYPDLGDIGDLIEECWAYDEREFQYVGLFLVRKFIKKFPREFIANLEGLILRKSWWDTVDALSVDAGTFLLKYDTLQPDITDRWIEADSFWLRRAAIIHQLKYREKTNWPMLQSYILRTCHENEFFIRKAAGWALRQYSKFHPAEVSVFIETNRNALSGLTIREGSKYI